MPVSAKIYRFLIFFAACVILGAGFWFEPLYQNQLFISFLAGGFSLATTLFPLLLGTATFSLTPVILLATGLIFSFTPVAIGGAIGILIGMILRRLLQLARPILGQQVSLLSLGFEIGLQILPLGIAIYGGSLVIDLLGIVPDAQWLAYLTPIVIFNTLHLVIFAVDSPFRQEIRKEGAWRKWSTLFVVEFSPILVILTAVITYPSLGLNLLFALFGGTILLAITLNRIGVTHLKLERRVQELSTLNLISRSLNSALLLEELLNNLYRQVAQLMQIDNFFVALYNEKNQEIWYPIAVKYGQQRSWPRRMREERLTDRVIFNKKPVLIARNAQKEIARIGMPTSEDAMYSWLGVPLVSGEQAIGCLGVFSIIPKIQFTQADLELLVTIAGQVSIAIENSLLYEQTKRRSIQLETLNDLSNLLSASLNLPEVLSQICDAVSQVTESRGSAIYLRDAQGRLVLTHAHRILPENQTSLASAFIRQLESQDWQHLEQANISRDWGPINLENHEFTALQAEKIEAWGNFPLATPDGIIGFLIVYFEQDHLPTSEQANLLQTFASQAAIGVQNARLYEKTDKALSMRVQQLAILEAVGRRLMANFETDQIFTIILDYAQEFTKSPWGFLCLYHPQEDLLEVKAKNGYSFTSITWPVSESPTGHTIRLRQAVNIPDVSGDSQYRDFTDGQAKSQLSVPLIYEDQVKGLITLESPHLNAYGENDVRLVTQLANYASLAINNAQLYSEAQRRLREQSTLYVVTSHLASSMELENLERVVIEAIQSAVQPTVVGIYLWDEAEQIYNLTHTSHDVEIPSNIMPDIFEQLVPISLNIDILKVPSSVPELNQLFAQQESLRAFVIPLETKKQKLGAILLQLPRERSLQPNHLQLLQAITAQATIALQNALLFADVLNARERLSTILNFIEEGILVVDTRGLIVLANQPVTKFTGQEISELIGTRLIELPVYALKIVGYTPNTASEMVQKLERGQGVESPKSTLVLDEVKPERVLERSATTVWSHGGRVIGVMMVLRDMTEEHQIQMARETITETLIHDLRSPISAVMSALEILSETVQVDQTQDELVNQALRVAQRGTERVFRLVNSLLEIARMQSGEIELEIRNFSLRELIDQVFSDHSIQASEYGIFLSNEVPTDLPDAVGDYGKIERVISNLVDNALKFTPAGGKIRITGEELSSHELIVRVSDNGPGVPEEFREKIFERFSQVPDQSSRRRGSGLGLTFCRLVAEAHGGKIWVEPNTPFGSSFVFTLPTAGTGS
jgi:PAS domain S-box-containing protein